MSAAAIGQVWKDAWPAALAAWSKYTRLGEPRWCLSTAEAKQEQLTGSFAMIRLEDLAVVIDLERVAKSGLEQFATEVLAHEVGHHVYCPANLGDHARSIARVRRGLPTLEREAPLVANLYTDLLINDRLQRSAGLDMAGVYRALSGGPPAKLWTLYLRMYEILWSLERGSLVTSDSDDVLEGDAQLGARLVRVYARDWLAGAGRFAALCLPYLLADGAAVRRIFGVLLDTQHAGAGGLPGGLVEIDADELDGAIHPADDPVLSGLDDPGDPGRSINRDLKGGRKEERTFREPFEYGEILKSAGLELSEAEVAARYYRERALPHLIRFPERELKAVTDPLPEGTEPWDVGSPLSEVDWLESVMTSPTVIPGVTTVRRTWGESPGGQPEKQPVDLYIGIDCSGSMPNPRYSVSYPVLAGVILALSALRAGARVMACLSGEPGRSVATPGFIGDERALLGLLTDYLGTGYGFGIHRLGPVFAARDPEVRPAHILIVTDSDIFEMLDNTLDRELGWDVAREAAKRAGGGATYVLNLRGTKAREPVLKRMREGGWDIHFIVNWKDLVTFAREFARHAYGREQKEKA